MYVFGGKTNKYGDAYLTIGDEDWNHFPSYNEQLARPMAAVFQRKIYIIELFYPNPVEHPLFLIFDPDT